MPKMHYFSCQNFPQALIRFSIVYDLKLKFLRLYSPRPWTFGSCSSFQSYLLLLPSICSYFLINIIFQLVLFYPWAFLTSFFLPDGSLDLSLSVQILVKFLNNLRISWFYFYILLLPFVPLHVFQLIQFIHSINFYQVPGTMLGTGVSVLNKNRLDSWSHGNFS